MCTVRLMKKMLDASKTRKNCFRYLKFMSPINAAICTTTYLERPKCYGPDKKILFKKQIFDLEVKGQGPTMVITVCDTPPYGRSCTHIPNIIDLSRKKQLFDLEVKGQGPTKVIMVCDHRLMVMHPHTKYH